jgi:hypothetical protein
MNGIAWKRVYKVREFEIHKRLSRNVIEDRELKENDPIRFIFVFNDVNVSHEVPREILREILEMPISKHPDRKK